MRNLALVLAVVAAPTAASAADQNIIVPAIIPSAHAAPVTPQPASPPANILNPPGPAATPRTMVAAAPSGPSNPAPYTYSAPSAPTAPGLVSTPNGGVMTALPNHPPPPLQLLGPNVPLTPRQQVAASISRRWRSRQSSPGEGADGSVVFMYGASVPSVVCSPLYVCSITLQAGEVVNDIKAGDSVRWLITPSIVGSGASQQTVVSVKPTDAGLRTNLVIATSRRLYDIDLVSSSNAHTDEISFRYPEDVASAWQQYRAQEQQQVAATTLASGQNLAALDFNYSLSGDNPAWRPLRVYSDGIKTYIQFPRSMLSGDAPALVALGNDGSWFSSPTKQIVNYRVEGDTYVVDRVLSRAALISGVGGSQSEVQISHTGGRS
jgi:type IV secretion system protein TrbG